MADRIYLIKQSARTLRIQAANVSEGYQPPSLEEDMADIGVAVFNTARAAPCHEQEVSCES